MTAAQIARQKGFKATLRTRGRKVKASTGESFFAVVQDDPPLLDPTTVIQAQKTIYSTVSAEAGCVPNPRLVKSLQEVDGRSYSVIRFDESAADAVVWKWFCEAQREQFKPAS